MPNSGTGCRPCLRLTTLKTIPCLAAHICLEKMMEYPPPSPLNFMTIKIPDLSLFVFNTIAKQDNLTYTNHAVTYLNVNDV